MVKYDRKLTFGPSTADHLTSFDFKRERSNSVVTEIFICSLNAGKVVPQTHIGCNDDFHQGGFYYWCYDRLSGG